MAKKKRKKKRRDDEILNPKSVSEIEDLMEMNRALERPLTPQAVIQLQRQYGNAYVQQVIINKQRTEEADDSEKEREAAEASARAASKTAIETTTTGSFGRDGRLTLDLAEVLHMSRYGRLSHLFRHNIDNWQGLAQLEMDERQFRDDQLQIDSQGRLKVNVDRDFIHRLSLSNNPESKEKQALLDFDRQFDVRLKTSLHYRSQDPRLQDNNIDGSERLLGYRQSHPGFFLKIEIESIYVIRVDDEPEEKRFFGEIILQGLVTT